ncbi:DEAD/DEAH box helicase [Acidianus brierleyi]|uniref:Helicase n=1 Tax=Acidianus brierleyi TaxID=41673 RepID=A0A2U9IEX3_9CREN|nr:DEAD/DEAH box helicase [Acidianus brierleyi]AWR94516.1 DEAD/DEAH box helicase [Acidianus brierleyi]
MLTAADFGKVLYSLGYTKLTPIQRIAIPKIISGKHTLIIAPTGSGKTEAAIIPLFYKIWNSRPEKISLLYITPLKALNRDLELRLKNLGNALGITIGTRHGDTSERKRKEILKSPPDLLITTPESLQYLIINQKYRDLLSNLKWIIIDELQEMLDEKRGYELSVVISRLKKFNKNKIQMIGLSATIGNIELAKKYLSDAEVEVAKVDLKKEYDIDLIIPDINDFPKKAIELNLDPYVISRLEKLKQIIETYKPIIIFTNTRETAEFLASELQALYNLKVATHHGSLSKDIRINIENNFKQGNLDAIIATSSLELGIDIGNINLVVQYMSPKEVTRLLQRIGRSGHSLNKVSKGIVIPSNYIYDIFECKSIIELSREGYLEQPYIELNALDVIAHEITGMVLEGVRNKEDILDILKNSVYFRDLSKDELENVVQLLKSSRILKEKDNQLLPSYRAWKYYYGTNMIPDSIRSYSVINMANNLELGKLDEDFVAMIDEESIFVLGGKLWKVVSIEDGKIFVDRAELKRGILPSWFGESIPVEKEVSERVYSYLIDAIKGKNYEFDEINDIIQEYKKRGYPELSNNDILVEIINGELIVVHSPFGSKGNNTLGSILSFYLNKIKGIRTSFRNDPYNIVIASVLPISKKDIEETITYVNKLSQIDARNIVIDAIKESPQFKWKLYIEAERFGNIDSNSKEIISSAILRQFSDTIVGEEAAREMLIKNHDLSVLTEIKKYTWKIVEVPSPSPLAKEFLDRLLITESEEAPVMLEVFKRRLLSKEVRVLCMVCGWNKKVSIEYSPEKCEKCQSVFLTATFPDDRDSIDIINKNIRGKKLSKTEMKKLKELKIIASLFSQYKKYALIALSARGVGSTNLGKALSKLSEGEESFYQNLFNVEKKFLKNRKYWQ